MSDKITVIENSTILAEEQLFTELTPEEGAVIEGGLTLKLYWIKAINANADWGRLNRDDTYIRVNNRTVWGVKKMKSGQKRYINKFVNFEDQANIQLFDKDLGKDDFMGGFTVSKRTGKRFTGSAWGSGSKYYLNYEVV